VVEPEGPASLPWNTDRRVVVLANVAPPASRVRTAAGVESMDAECGASGFLFDAAGNVAGDGLARKRSLG